MSMSTQRVVRRRYTCSCGWNVLVRETDATRAQALVDGKWVPGHWCSHCRKVITKFREEPIVPMGMECGRCKHIYIVDSAKARGGAIACVCPMCGYMPQFAEYHQRGPA